MDHPTAIEANLPASGQPACDRTAEQFHSLGEAVSTARNDARRLAGEAAPKLKRAVRTIAFDAAYGAAFGACFAAAFAREIAPQAVKDGLARGARAGRAAAAKAKSAIGSLSPKQTDDSCVPVAVESQPC
jgi:hypothetical protein